MGFAIRDLIQKPPLSTGQVVAGHKGLDNQVVGFIFLEIPPQHRKVSSILTFSTLKDKIILSSLYAESDNLPGQLATIQAIYETGAKGLMLFHVGFFIPEVSEQIVQLCNELEFPLIVLPGDVLFSHAMTPILDFMFEEQHRKLKHAQEIYDRLSGLVLKEKDTADIINELSLLIHRRVLFFDYTCTCTASSGGNLPPELETLIANSIFTHHSRLLENNEEVRISTEGAELLLAPVASSMSFYGTVVILKAENLSELDRIAIQQTQNALGITSIVRIRYADYRARLQQDFIRDLLHWRFSGPDAVRERAAVLGISTARLHIVVLFHIHNGTGGTERGEAVFSRQSGKLFSTIRMELSDLAPDSLIAVMEDSVAVLLSSGKGEAAACKLATVVGNRVIRTAGESEKWQVSAGVGGYAAALQDLSKSYQQAVDTLQIARRLFGPSRCTSYRDVPIYTLLRGVDRGGVQESIHGLLAPLIEYDAANSSELTHTLQVLLECELNFVLAAERMYLHKNTIRQRKNKMMELLDFNPFEQPFRTQLEIAFLLDKILGEA